MKPTKLNAEVKNVWISVLCIGLLGIGLNSAQRKCYLLLSYHKLIKFYQ